MTTDERFEHLEKALTQIADSQVNTWKAIAATQESIAANQLAISALTKEHANLLSEIRDLKSLMEWFIKSQHGNGHN